MKRVLQFLSLLIVGGVLFWTFPPFRVVRSDAQSATPSAWPFNAAEFADTFWRERLVPSLANVPDAARVLEAIDENLDNAGEQFGRKVGVSRTRLYTLRGSGMVTSIEKNGVIVALDGDKEHIVTLHAGLLFGNTVRDSTGLLDASDFPNSQHYNDVSSELNRIVEERTIAPLKQEAATGRRIRFVGCTEVHERGGSRQPLKIIPLEVAVD